MATTQYVITAETERAWVAGLQRAAEGLDFTDADDRAAFRMRVQAASRNVLRSHLVTLARHFGATVPGNATNAAAARALADAWIAS